MKTVRSGPLACLREEKRTFPWLYHLFLSLATRTPNIGFLTYGDKIKNLVGEDGGEEGGWIDGVGGGTGRIGPCGSLNL